jgi:hypothetical protein
MPAYVNFLKAPRRDGDKIWSVINITNDLGEAVVEEIQFSVQLLDGSSAEKNHEATRAHTYRATREYVWKPGMQELKIEVEFGWNMTVDDDMSVSLTVHSKECSIVGNECGWNDENEASMRLDRSKIKRADNLESGISNADDDEWEDDGIGYGDDNSDESDDNEDAIDKEGPWTCAHQMILPCLEHSICQNTLHVLVGAQAFFEKDPEECFERSLTLHNFTPLELSQPFGTVTLSGHIW